jgi:hypothetical protein
MIIYEKDHLEYTGMKEYGTRYCDCTGTGTGMNEYCDSATRYNVFYCKVALVLFFYSAKGYYSHRVFTKVCAALKNLCFIENKSKLLFRLLIGILIPTVEIENTITFDNFDQ